MPDKAKKPTPPQPEERHYKKGSLNKWFSVGSIILLVCIVIAFAQDYGREWKTWQRKFRRIDQQVTRAQYEEERARLLSDSKLANLEEEVNEAELDYRTHQNEKKEAERIVRGQKAAFDIVNSSYQNTKAELDKARYRNEQANAGVAGLGLDVSETKRVLEKLEIAFFEIKAEKEQIEIDFTEANEAVAAFSQEVQEAQRDRNKVRQEAELIKRRLSRIDPEFMTVGMRVANLIRDLPILDLSQPSLKVEQVVLPDIKEDMPFAKVARVDRCITCHTGINREEFSSFKNPHRAHPNLALAVGSKSVHPLEEFGCTSCHAGRGRATDFYGSVHSPNFDDQEESWVKDHDWKEYHLWEEPMHPLRYAEAGCFQCHSGEAQIQGAAKLNYGLNIIEQAGCYSCHEIEHFKDHPMRGPSLRKLAAKTSTDFAFQWIKNPAGFRAQTWMPAYFGQTNNSDTESVTRSDQEILAIVSYLFAKSENYDMKPIPVRGDGVRGEELVAAVGCMGCHQAAQETLGNTERSVTSQQEIRRQFGPNFQGIGSKTNEKWLYNWLKNPKSYHADTRMPSLRLSDQEAADITAYLIGSTDEGFIRRPVPDVNSKILDGIVSDFLSTTLVTAEVNQQLDQMGDPEKLEFAGERLIAHYGCYSCHEIAGFENSKPIGVALTNIGKKSLHKFDFGFTEIDHNKYSWWTAKLDNPRVFDMHREVIPLAKSRMPNFRLTEDQIEAAVTALAGFVEVKPELTKIVPRTPDRLRIEEGQQLVRQMNCQGCHVIGEEGGAVVERVADWLTRFQGKDQADAETLSVSFSPPNLYGEGRKVQTDWLFGFFHEPMPIRPWLSMRMPSYGMTAEHRNALISYFTALDDVSFPFTETVEIDLSPEKLRAAQAMFSPDYFNCTTCHVQGNKYPPGSPQRWAPNLALAYERLRPDWIVDWLANPQELMPGTRMPSFYPTGAPYILEGDADQQLFVLRDYVLSIGKE